MSRLPKIAFAFAALTVLPAWTLDVEPISVSVGGLATERPVSNISPNDRQAGPWHEVDIDIDQPALRSLARWKPTFRLMIDDCAGKVVSVEDLFVDGKSIGHIINDEPSVDALRETKSSVRLTAFLLEKVFQENPQICASLSGGNTLGAAIKQHCYRLKPEPAQTFGLRGEDPPGPRGEAQSAGLCGSS